VALRDARKGILITSHIEQSFLSWIVIMTVMATAMVMIERRRREGANTSATYNIDRERRER